MALQVHVNTIFFVRGMVYQVSENVYFILLCLLRRLLPDYLDSADLVLDLHSSRFSTIPERTLATLSIVTKRIFLGLPHSLLPSTFIVITTVHRYCFRFLSPGHIPKLSQYILSHLTCCTFYKI